MDTREKIGKSYPGGVAFIAHFDLLSTELVQRIQEEGEAVIAVVIDPTNPLLPARTRAELAASLAKVAAVVPCSGDLEAVLKHLQPAKIVHWETQDAERTSNLIEHVRALYRSK